MATATAGGRDVLAGYEPVIGLEVHCQLLTKTKLFCSCRNRFGDEPNRNVCPVCLGLPGALPVLSRQAVELAIEAAIAETSANSPKAMGAVIKAAKARLEGKAVDGKVLSDRVRERLSKMG